MKKSFENQLNQWRKINNVPTMQEILKGTTFPVRDGKTWAVVVPYLEMKTTNEEAIAMYLAYRKIVISIQGTMLELAQSGDKSKEASNKAKDLKLQYIKITKYFYDNIREASGINTFIGVSQDIEDVMEKQELTVNIYAMPYKEGKVYDVAEIGFTDDLTGGQITHPCLLIPQYRKKESVK